MTPQQFTEARLKFGLSQGQMATILGYSTYSRISDIETGKNQRGVPALAGRLMHAYLRGYRPRDWPKEAALG